MSGGKEKRYVNIIICNLYDMGIWKIVFLWD